MERSMEANIAKWKAGLSGGNRFANKRAQPVMTFVDGHFPGSQQQFQHTPVKAGTPTAVWNARR